MIDIESYFRDKIYEASKKKVYDLADSIRNHIHYETSNDLQFAGKGNDKKALDDIDISIVEESKQSFKLVVDLDGLTDDQKESYKMYFNNGKVKALA